MKIKIHPETGVAYFPKDVREQGFVGDVEGLADALTITLIRPGTSLDDVKTSLLSVLGNVELRMKYSVEGKGGE